MALVRLYGIRAREWNVQCGVDGIRDCRVKSHVTPGRIVRAACYALWVDYETLHRLKLEGRPLICFMLYTRYMAALNRLYKTRQTLYVFNV